MSHLKINYHFGINPVQVHTPVDFIQVSPNINLSVGKDGECIRWDDNYEPIYAMLPTLNNQAQQLKCYSVVNSTNLVSETSRLRFVTVHEDNRLRIWRLQDGVCINVSRFKALEEPIKGICADVQQCRFIYLHSESTIIVFDMYKMTVASKLKTAIKIQKLSKNNKYLVVRDQIKKMYAISIEEIAASKWFQAEHIIADNRKIIDQMNIALNKFENNSEIKEVNDVLGQKQIFSTKKDKLEQLKRKLSCSVANTANSLFDSQTIAKYPDFMNQLNNQQITQSCLVFINNSSPYVFIGCKSGAIYGFCLMKDIRNNKLVVWKDESHKKEIRYLNVRKNTLIASSYSNLMTIYTFDNLDLATQNQMKNKGQNQNQVIFLNLNKYIVYSNTFTNPVKYLVQTYKIPSKFNETNNNDLLALELENKQIIIINMPEKTSCTLRGFSKEIKILSVLIFDFYFGVVTNSCIYIYRQSAYQRSMSYQNWDWKDYNLFRKRVISDDYHNYKYYKEQYNNCYLIDFNHRFCTKVLNYFDPQFQLEYENFGKIDEESITNQQYGQFYFYSRRLCDNIIYSRNMQSFMSIVKLRHDKQTRESWSNTSYIIHSDVKNQIESLNSEANQTGNQNQEMNSFSFLFPFHLDETLNRDIYKQKVTNYNRPILCCRLAYQGVGTSLTIYLNPNKNFQISEFLTSYQALVIMLYFISLCNKDTNSNSITDLMFKCIELFTTKKPASFKPLNLNDLAFMSIENSSNVVNAGCNLLISAMLGKELKLDKIETLFVMNLKYLEENKSRILSKIQIYWIIMIGLGYIYSSNETPRDKTQRFVNRLVNSIQINNFERVPDLMAISLKILNQGIAKWKNIIEPPKAYEILNNLFVLYFYYDGLAVVPKEDKKFNFCFATEDKTAIKRMKQIIVKTVVYIANQYTNEFLQVLKKQALNQDVHLLYPCSVIQILRQFLKSQKPTKHLVFYIELLLKCLAPTTPNLRKHVQKNVTQTLYYMCSYPTISFNQASQKIALLSSNHIYIYDLKTATKWRTIDIESGEGVEYSVEMSPKGNYIAVLGKKLRIWRLSIGFWSGVLGAFSQGWEFEAKGKVIKWQANQASITVESNVPGQTKRFQL